MIVATGQVILAIVLLLALVLAGYLVSLRLQRGAGASLRLGSAVVFACWLGYLIFQILGSLGRWTLPWIVPVLLLSLLVAQRLAAPLAEVRYCLASDLRELAARAREVLRQPWCAVALAALALPAAVQLLRATVRPPLAWDSLVYHLFKAGRWVQTGHWPIERSVEIMDGSALYPPGGEVIWAWAMLATRDARFIGLAGIGIWLLCGLAFILCLRAVQLDRARAVTGAVVLLLVPAISLTCSAAYVDNTLLFFFLMSAAFLVRFASHGRPVDALYAGLALANAASVKHSGLAIAAVGGSMVLVVALFRGGPRRNVLASWALFMAGLAPGTLSYVRAWIDHGSPTMPFSMTLPFGLHFSGLEQTLRSFRHGSAVDSLFQDWTFWRALFLEQDHGRHLNFGQVGPLILLLGLAGICFAWRGRRSALGVFLLLCSALFVFHLLQPDMARFRGGHRSTVGRLLLPIIASATLFAALIPSRVITTLFAVAALLQVPGALPPGWHNLDTSAWLDLLHSPWLWCAGLSALALVLLRDRRHRLAAAATFALAAVALAGWTVPRVRAKYRIPMYRAAVTLELFDFHPLGRCPKDWPVWMALDTPEEKRVTISVGKKRYAAELHYPLLGSSLQNEVFHAQVSRSGEDIDYQTGRWKAPRPDLKRWLARLRRRRVTHLYVRSFQSNEYRWARQLPERFKLLARTKGEDAALYQIR